MLIDKEYLEKGEKGFVFVYGTLKVGGHFAQSFNHLRLSSIPAKAKGTMYEGSSWFPAVIFGGEKVVIGELHEYEQIDRVLRQLDYIEGYREEGSKHNLYNRRKVVVTTDEGKEVEAYSYEFNHSVESLDIREDGIWPI